MDFKYLLLRQFRFQSLNKALNIRTLTTQNCNAVKKLYLSQSKHLLPVHNVIKQSVRNSKSNLPLRKRGFVWQGRKEEMDYDRSGLLVGFYYNAFLMFVLFIFMWKKGMLH